MNKVLVLVPHGDDEVLGFGGTISKHVRNSDNVQVGFLKASAYSDRIEQQHKNIHDAYKVLGYDKYHKLNLNLNYINHDLITSVENFLNDINPNILYIPHANDVHQDHSLTVDLAKISTRIFSLRKVYKIFSGEIISSSYNCFSTKKYFSPNYFVKLEKEDIIKKQKAIECYSSEVRLYPHPRSPEGIEIFSKKRGMECGFEYAEAFECLRYIDL